MSSNLRQRFCVALTGFSNEERERLIGVIKKLGGMYNSWQSCDQQGFTPSCTHVICSKPTRSEKFLAACATGKWIVTSKWLLDSAKKGKWLNEDDYEWSPKVPCQPSQQFQTGILAAPKKWRKTIASSGVGPFSDWKAAVVVADERKRVVYKRLLRYGGCKVIELKVQNQKFNLTEVVNSEVLYIFLDEGTKASASTLFECGVMCLHPEFIGDFLVASPSPDPSDYTIGCAITGSQRSIASTQQSSALISCSQSSATSTTDLCLPRSESHVQEFQPEIIEVSRRGSKRMCVQEKRGVDEVDSCCVKVTKKKRSGLTMRPGTNSQSSNSSLDNSGSQSSSEFQESAITRGKRKRTKASSSVHVLSNTKSDPKQQSLLLTLAQKTTLSTLIGKSVVPNDLSVSNKPNDLSASEKIVEKTLSVIGAGTVQGKTVLKKLREGSPRKESGKSATLSQSRKSVSSVVDSELSETQASPLKLSVSTRSRVSQLLQNVIVGVSDVQHSLDTAPRIKTVSTGITPGSTPSPTSTPPPSRSSSPCTFNKRLEVKLMRLESKSPRRSSPKSVVLSEPTKDSSSVVSKPTEGTSTSSIVGKPPGSNRLEVKLMRLESQSPRRSLPKSVVLSEPTKDSSSVVSKPTEGTSTSSIVGKPPGSNRLEVKLMRLESQSPLRSLPKSVVLSEPTKDSSSVVSKPTEGTSTSSIVGKSPGSNSCGVPKYTNSGTGGAANSGGDKSSSVLPTSSAIDHEITDKLTSDDSRIDPKIGAKRKLTDDDTVLGALQVIKKKKISEVHWMPTQIFSPKSAKEDLDEKDYLSVMPMSNALCNIFEAAVEENHFLSSLDIILSSMSTSKYPTARVIYHIIQGLLASDDAASSEEAFSTLMNILHMHPPSSSAMRTIYLQSLLNPAIAEHPKCAEWDFINTVMEKCLGNSEEFVTNYRMEEKKAQPVDPVLLEQNCRSVLKFIVAFLEQDYLSFSQRDNSKRLKRTLLLGQLLWPGGVNLGVVNRSVRDLLDCFTAAISQSIGDEGYKDDSTSQLQSLVFLAFECICLSEGRGTDTRFSFGPKTSLFLHELTNRLLSEFGDQPEHLLKAIETMKSPKLVMRVSQLALDTLDDSLLPEDEGDELTLEKIVQHYFYLLPKLVGVTAMTTPKKKKTSPLSSVGNSQPTPSSSFNTPLSQAKRSLSNHASPNVSSLKFGKNINKRNPKGETLLHVACIKNNVVRVRELLTIPGIDVNVTDFAGWTPLHEACNHGHVECIKELLVFKPHKTITSYFGKEKTNGIDMLAANEEGITPLHDAVLNDHKEAVRLLLCHGGAKLLKPRTVLGFSPADLAETDEMRELLTTKDFSSLESPCKKRVSLSFLSSQSQDSFSQQSQTSNLSFNDSSLGPCDEAYEEVLGPASLRKASTSTDCYKYVLFVYHLLQSYLEVYGICAMFDYVLEADPDQKPEHVELFDNVEEVFNDDNNNLRVSEHDSDKLVISRTRSGRVVQKKTFGDYVTDEKNRLEKKPDKLIDFTVKDLVETVPETAQKTHSGQGGQSLKTDRRELGTCQKDLAIYVDLDSHIKQFKHHLATISNQTIDDVCKMVLIQMSLFGHDYLD
ncbi:uncharacterized protein LOC135499324 [Lineus longissimus]|uniref:uncharacterized protein LOC135499324 n=1 Tax=Lineus longissimus TaxID=88925 RepID=UPI002B4D5CB5